MTLFETKLKPTYRTLSVLPEDVRGSVDMLFAVGEGGVLHKEGTPDLRLTSWKFSKHSKPYFGYFRETPDGALEFFLSRRRPDHRLAGGRIYYLTPTVYVKITY